MVAPPSAPASRPLVYAHLGDLHLTSAQATTYRYLLAMLAQLAVEAAGQLDFVYLPGDVADNGQPAQYRLVAAELAQVPPGTETPLLPLHTYPTDLRDPAERRQLTALVARQRRGQRRRVGGKRHPGHPARPQPQRPPAAPQPARL